MPLRRGRLRADGDAAGACGRRAADRLGGSGGLRWSLRPAALGRARCGLGRSAGPLWPRGRGRAVRRLAAGRLRLPRAAVVLLAHRPLRVDERSVRAAADPAATVLRAPAAPAATPAILRRARSSRPPPGRHHRDRAGPGPGGRPGGHRRRTRSAATVPESPQGWRRRGTVPSPSRAGGSARRRSPAGGSSRAANASQPSVGVIRTEAPVRSNICPVGVRGCAPARPARCRTRRRRSGRRTRGSGRRARSARRAG